MLNMGSPLSMAGTTWLLDLNKKSHATRGFCLFS
jgi:hypothetical protein